MIGAIIGDLAAWTYENDRDTFWKQLISNDAKEMELSVYGHAYFRAASRNVMNAPRTRCCLHRDESERGT